MKKRVYTKGLKDGVSIGLGYFGVSFAFGIQASSAGLTALAATLMSFMNLTSAGQVAAVGVIAAGASYAEMALTQFVINMRYLLMSTALSQKLEKGVSTPARMLMAHGVTDEIFGLSMLYPSELSPYYMYGLMSAAIPGWCLGTLLGAASGSILPARVVSALGIAIYGMFLAVIVPASRKSRPVLLVVLSAALLSVAIAFVPVFSGVSEGIRVIIVTLAVSAAAAALFPLKEENGDAG